MATGLTNLSVYNKDEIPNAKQLRFGIVVSAWNDNITEQLFKGAYAALLDCGAQEKNIVRWNVPGSFELVFGSSHFDYVCGATAQGIKDLNVKFDVPVIFCVLTDDTLQQSIDRSGGKHGNKGIEAAIVAIQMAVLGK